MMTNDIHMAVAVVVREKRTANKKRSWKYTKTQNKQSEAAMKEPDHWRIEFNSMTRRGKNPESPMLKAILLQCLYGCARVCASLTPNWLSRGITQHTTTHLILIHMSVIVDCNTATLKCKTNGYFNFGWFRTIFTLPLCLFLITSLFLHSSPSPRSSAFYYNHVPQLCMYVKRVVW